MYQLKRGHRSLYYIYKYSNAITQNMYFKKFSQFVTFADFAERFTSISPLKISNRRPIKHVATLYITK